jgi:hypothetical protein
LHINQWLAEHEGKKAVVFVQILKGPEGIDPFMEMDLTEKAMKTDCYKKKRKITST